MLRIVADILPAKIPTFGIDNSRVVILSEPYIMMVYEIVEPSQRAMLTRNIPYTSFDRIGAKDFRIITESEEIIDVSRVGSCGCGSALTRIPLQYDINKIQTG